MKLIWRSYEICSKGVGSTTKQFIISSHFTPRFAAIFHPLGIKAIHPAFCQYHWKHICRLLDLQQKKQQKHPSHQVTKVFPARMYSNVVGFVSLVPRHGIFRHDGGRPVEPITTRWTHTSYGPRVITITPMTDTWDLWHIFTYIHLVGPFLSGKSSR